MQIFESARIRLTAWYLIIIAFISVSFSAIIYRDFTSELNHGYERAGVRLMAPGNAFFTSSDQRDIFLSILDEDLNSAKKTVLIRLVVINTIILFIAGVGGYFLAGITLSPIEAMINGQKRFVADASHELKTPITALITEIEVALRNKRLQLSDAKDILKSSLDEVSKLKDFTQYLLSLSRYEAGGDDIPREKVDLSEAVRQAIERNIPLAKKSKIKIIQDLKEVVTIGEPQSIVELVSILINNAIKYSPKNTEIRVSLMKVGRKAVIKVRDHGIGIDEKDLPHIFDRFYRADCSRCKQEVDGYGLGLSIAKSIVESHKGTIDVESKPNKGSEFTVTLPRLRK